MQKDENEKEAEDESEEQAGLLTKIVKCCCEIEIREANLGSKATISKGCIKFEVKTQKC